MNVKQSVWFEAPEKVSLRSEELADPKPDEYLVEASLSSISSGSERTLLSGHLNRSLSLDPVFAREQTLDFPFPYGYQMVGYVVAQGNEVAQDLLNQRVFCFAPHSNYAFVKHGCIYPVPDNASDLQASLLANMETALSLVWDLHPSLGEKVAVFGQGIVGILVSMLLSRCGISELSVFDLSCKQRELAQRLKYGQVYEKIEQEDMVEAAIEVSGNAKALESCLLITKPHGRIVIGSWYQDSDKIQLGTLFHRKRQQILSSQVSSVNSFLSPYLTKARRLSEALKLIHLIPVDFFDAKIFNIDEVETAYQTLMQGQKDLLVFSYK